MARARRSTAKFRNFKDNSRVLIEGEKELNAKLNKMAEDLQVKIKNDALMAGAKVVQLAAAAKAKGSIAGAIQIEIERGQARIGPDSDHFHAIFFELGVKKHVIKVKRKSVLSDGKQFFGREVNHPGIKKQPFLRPALDDNEEQIKRTMGQVIARGVGAK